MPINNLIKSLVCQLVLTLSLTSLSGFAQGQENIQGFKKLSDITLPTSSFIQKAVIEVPFDDVVAVQEKNTGQWQEYARKNIYVEGAQVKSATLDLPEALAASKEAQKLFDNNPQTFLDLPSAGTNQTAVIDLETNKIADIVGINLVLDPSSPSIKELEISNIEAGRDVLIYKGFVASGVSFPSNSLQKVRIKLKYDRPVRINDIYLVENGQTAQSSQVTFLARPGQEYLLYRQGRVAVLSGSGSVLNSTAGEVRAGLSPLRDNPQFRELDQDEDSIPDTKDNCPQTSNQDQKDINSNNRGDVCDDLDGDGIFANRDNCPDNSNPGQEDIDADGKGDQCDSEDSRFLANNQWIVYIVIGAVLAIVVLSGFLIMMNTPDSTRE